MRKRSLDFRIITVLVILSFIFLGGIQPQRSEAVDANCVMAFHINPIGAINQMLTSHSLEVLNNPQNYTAEELAIAAEFLGVEQSDKTCQGGSVVISGSMGYVRHFSSQDTVKVEREITGSKLFELPVTEDVLDGISNNPKDNTKAVAMGQDGKVIYHFTGDEYEILYEGIGVNKAATPPDFQVLSRIILEDVLPSGVQSNNNSVIRITREQLPMKLVNIRTQRRQIGRQVTVRQVGTRVVEKTRANGDTYYVEEPICATVSKPLYTTDTYVTYKLIPFEIEENLFFEIEGQKNFNGLTVKYGEAGNGQKNAKILNNPSLHVFKVRIPEILLLDGNADLSNLTFKPIFDGLNGGESLVSAKVIGEGSGMVDAGNAMINGLSTGVKDIEVLARFSGDEIGFKTKALVYQLEAENVVGVKGHTKAQEVKLEGLAQGDITKVTPLIDHIKHNDYYKLIQNKIVNPEELELTYSLIKEIKDPEEVEFITEYLPVETKITRKRMFWIVIVDLDEKSAN
jgi:hypothetical protein